MSKTKTAKGELNWLLLTLVFAIIIVATLGLGLGFGLNLKSDTLAEALSEFDKVSLGQKQVSAGGPHTAYIDAQGNLWTWGNGSRCELGNMSTANSSTPINITAQPGNPLNGKQVVQVSAGGNHTMAIDAQGSLWAFGDNLYGCLGNMSTANSSTPINITAQSGNPLNGKQIIQVSAGSGYTIAVDAQGSLWAFGYGYNGCLGNMSSNYTNSTPINITAQSGNPLNGKQIVQVSAGYMHTMAIDTSGNLWAFGDGWFGKLGNMSTSSRSTPINLTAQSGNPLNGKQITQVSVGESHTVAIDSQGNLWLWGYNSDGQLGNMTTTGTNSNSTPISISTQSGNPLLGKQIVSVSVGNSCTTVIDAQGSLWTFGQGSYGQLGNMSTTRENHTPINITAQSGNPLNGKQILQVSSAVGTGADVGQHTMVIDTQGNLWAFGLNFVGQLGNMTTTEGFESNSTPINITAQPNNPLAIASASATITGSPNARISVRTNFTAGWGTTTASGGTYTTWTADALASPNVKRNDSTEAGRIRYEFDATGIDTVSVLTINSTAVSLTDYSNLTLWNNVLYLRILTNGSILIVEMDRINTVQLVTLSAITTRNVKHSFNFSNNSHLSSRMKITSGKETTSLTHIFDNLTWNNDKATTTFTIFTFTSQVAFTKITISRPLLSDIVITDFINPIISVAGLTGTLIYTPGSTNTATITITGMEQHEYIWTIETITQIQVQKIYNPPAGATAIANPALLTLNSSSGAGWADAALAPPADLFNKTFDGWYTHPTYGSKISSIEDLQQQINSTGGAIVFLYAHWA